MSRLPPGTLWLARRGLLDRWLDAPSDRRWISALVALVAIAIGTWALLTPTTVPENDARSTVGAIALPAGPTTAEARALGDWPIARAPLPATLPPPQLPARIEQRALFGLSAAQRAPFAEATAALAQAGGRCDRALQAKARGALERIPPGSGDRARGFIAYHHGLVGLCDGAGAIDQFRAARAIFARATNARRSPRERRWLTQYTALATYGEGLARARHNERDAIGPDEAAAADALFVAAMARTADGALYGKGGRFVRLSTARGDLFEFDTARIVGARVALWSREGDRARAIATAAPALADPGAAMVVPDLAANTAVAAVLACAERKACRVRPVLAMLDALPAAEAQRGTWPSEARARLIAAAIVAGASKTALDQFPAGQDNIEASAPRRAFERRGASREGWFAPVALGAAGDGRRSAAQARDARAARCVAVHRQPARAARRRRSPNCARPMTKRTRRCQPARRAWSMRPGWSG